MNELYRDYYWKKGRPYGRGKIQGKDTAAVSQGYKIISDPYHKRFSIEKYSNGSYTKTVYDSNLFDFRNLKPQDQVAWEKEVVEEGKSYIRDENDRLILIETNSLKDGVIRSCTITTPHGVSISRQELFYEKLGDSWSGVLLYDRNDHLVMKKVYRCDEEGSFVEVVEECWDFEEVYG